MTKVGARADAEGDWPEALGPDELRRPSTTTCDNLGVDVLDVVNLRRPAIAGPWSRLARRAVRALAELQQEGLIRHLGVSNVTDADLAEAQAIAPIVCVQNHLQPRAPARRPAGRRAAPREGIAYVPFFPLGGFTPLQSAALEPSRGGWRRRRWRWR